MNKEAALNEIYQSAYNDELEKIAIAPLVAGAVSLGARALPWLARGASKLFTRGAAKAGGKMAAQGAAFEGGSAMVRRGMQSRKPIRNMY